MTANRSLVIVTTALLVAAFAAGAAVGKKPEASEDGDKIVLANDYVRVWFQGKKPMLKVFPANESNASAYEYHFTDLVEYRDVDGDGGPSNQEVVASLALNRANAWNVTRSEGEGNVTLNLTLVAPVRLAPGVQLPQNVTSPSGVANVSIVFHVFEETTTIDNVTVPRTAVKYDLVVSSWPFVNANVNRLALESLVGGMLELDNSTGLEGATVVANDTELGALTWVSNATGYTANGTVDVPVRANVALEEGNMSRLVFTYDAPGLTGLVHDPTIGTSGTAAESGSGEEGGNAVPAPALVLVAMATVAAALVMRRK